MAVSDSNATLRAAIQELGRKIDDFIASLPQTYVQIRNHDLQIKAHEDRLNDAFNQIAELQRWRNDMVNETNEEHNEMRREWQAELKEVSATVNNIDKNVHSMNVTAKWVLGVFSAVLIAVLVAYVTKVLMHL